MRSYSAFEDAFEGVGDVISYITGCILILCAWFKVSKKWILGLGIIFLVIGKDKKNVDKKLQV